MPSGPKFSEAGFGLSRIDVDVTGSWRRTERRARARAQAPNTNRVPVELSGTFPGISCFATS
jgi:hypothetical protein